MATYYSQSSGVWSTLARWDTNPGGGGSDPASVAAMEDNLFIIQAGHNIDYDLDTSAWTVGFQTITIQGHATTPGMLRCDSTTEADATYTVPMKTGFSIDGTAGAEKGRILCNADGVWANSVDCENGVKFIIKTLAGSSAVTTIDATYLNNKILCTEPTDKYVEIYGCPFVVTFDHTTEKFTIASPTNTPAIPPNGTPIVLSGTVPAELTAGTTYFVKAVSGATGELEATIGGGTIAITDNGSGTIYMHYGCWGPVDQSTAVNLTNGVITWNGVPPAANTTVRVKSSGTLPTGFSSYDLYYVRTVSGNTCKLSLIDADDVGIVIPTGAGTGNISMYCGSTYTNSKVVNVIQNVTADIWSTTTGFNRVVLCDFGPVVYDQQRDLLATIAIRYMVLTNLNIDSAQYPLARLYLSTRNVSIQSLSTSTANYLVTTSVGGTFKCEFTNLYAPGTVTTFYSQAFYNSSNNTVSGTITGVAYAFNGSGTGNNISSIIAGSETPINLFNNNTFSGTLAGCAYTCQTSNGNTFSGLILGCSYAFYTCNNNTISTTIVGGNTAYSEYSSGNTISGSIIGCYYAFITTSDNTISGSIIGCGYAFYRSINNIVLGSIVGCVYVSSTMSSNTISGLISICKYIVRFSNVLLKNALIAPEPPVPYAINTSNQKFRVFCENYGRVSGAYKIFDNFGDIIKTACDGAGDAPSVDPDGGHDYCLEASNLQDKLGIPAGSIYPNKLAILEKDKHRIWLSAASHTITYKAQTTFAGISAGNLILTSTHLDANGAEVETTNAPAIAQRSDDTDWTQTLAVTIVPGRACWCDFRIDLQEYEAGNEVYVWPNPAVT